MTKAAEKVISTPGPVSALRAWPGSRPLAALWVGTSAPCRLAEPAGRLVIRGVMERGRLTGARSEWRDAMGHKAPSPFLLTHDPLADIEVATQPWRMDRPRAKKQPFPQPPPLGRGSGVEDLLPGWIGYLSYDLGRLIEPAAQCAARRRDAELVDWPLAELLRCERGPAWPIDGPAFPACAEGNTGTSAAELGRPPYSLTLDRDSLRRNRRWFMDAAGRVIGLIRAGDVFQANLAHRLEFGFTGSARALMASIAAAARPLHGMYLESPAGGARRAVLSFSPELFIDADFRTGRIVTRPMKGTRASRLGARGLQESAKDAAELNMITDLMRNDLGRVCRFGSVRVADARAIERHGGAGGVFQGVSTVTGDLRPGVGVAELLRAVFPPGSVTGAPKIRAMQLIDELEPHARGPYCGVMGVFSDSGRVRLAVGIRTALLTGTCAGDEAPPYHFDRGVLRYSVGAGIVADSDPHAEWRETLAKASILRHAGAPR